jgi:7-cyano-7-deazaguanine reductase
MTPTELRALGTARATFDGLETFAAPAGLGKVLLVSDECCAVCPVTGQPDWYTIEATYAPSGGKCIESKTFKLYVQSFKNDGMFCEQFASRMASDISAAVASPVTVTVRQKPRGGVAIHATATIGD